MKIQIKPGFLFPTQFWTAELNENIEQLQKEAYLIRKNDKDGVVKSNSGFQSYHSKDIRDLNNLPGTNHLLKQIINAVNTIHQISRKGDLQLTNFWINISGKGSSNTPHTHSGLTYSGVFFIKVPKEMKGGRFLFYRNFNEADFISSEYMGLFKEGYQMQGYDYPINTISPKENLLVVFPSWVPHAVEINLSDEERISLSFNFKLNRTF
ncbi:TIGR02466 family protein [Prochlorococcus sp. MIT 0604]|uniref:TIGR02466 family protein n=1 Tax=Prochlorococcus sp. MIT 0604 TaxID=1501268 RepID=UPI0004F8374D|nr:TIGR02466 family protein [Prochlorococcus sp. MIT 0604]AIQ95411.1 hypothetical protein EW14_1399 [Prochlorococcus sp. MIT 0604]